VGQCAAGTEELLFSAAPATFVPLPSPAPVAMPLYSVKPMQGSWREGISLILNFAFNYPLLLRLLASVAFPPHTHNGSGRL